MAKESESFLQRARKWAKANGLTGPQAFLRYVIFNFVEAVNSVSDDFVFKGGNLLWWYIKTPRATVDLDFSTLRKGSHAEIKAALAKACAYPIEGITFSISSFKKVQQQAETGAAVIVSYRTQDGAENEFGLDVVYALPVKHAEIPSPVHRSPKIQVATVENIIADKLAACVRFKAGNTRMKDYDDLWRLCHSDAPIAAQELAALFKSREIPSQIDPTWIGPDIERQWASHQNRYPDLPKNMTDVFDAINSWLKKKNPVEHRSVERAWERSKIGLKAA